MLQARGGYICHGVECMITILHIQNWNNNPDFAPEPLLTFFKNALAKRKSCIAKITMDQTQLTIINGDNSIHTLGFEYPKHSYI